MKIDIESIKYFLTVGMFMKTEHSSRRRNMLIRQFQKFYLTVKFFFVRDHAASTAQLSFSTIMAIVPIASMILLLQMALVLGSFLKNSFEKCCLHNPKRLLGC